MARRFIKSFCLFLGLIGGWTTNAFAEEFTVTAVGVKYEPMVVIMQPGDRVSWTNMPAHNVETIDAMVPEGAEKINSELGMEYSYVFENEGIYVYKCAPHWGARMGGVILVGTPSDIEGVIDAYLAEIEKDKSLLPAKGLLKKFKKQLQQEGIL